MVRWNPETDRRDVVVTAGKAEEITAAAFHLDDLVAVVTSATHR